MADLSSTRVFGKLTVLHDALLKANAEITGNLTAANFIGKGSSITDLNANNLTSGTVNNARLPTTATRWPQFAEVTGKPATYPASTHTHPWAQITGQPATATRWPSFAEVTGRPTTYPATAHTHPWSEVTGQPVTATRWPSFAEVTGKPSSYTPSTHNHALTDVTGLTTALDGKRDVSDTFFRAYSTEMRTFSAGTNAYLNLSTCSLFVMGGPVRDDMTSSLIFNEIPTVGVTSVKTFIIPADYIRTDHSIIFPSNIDWLDGTPDFVAAATAATPFMLIVLLQNGTRWIGSWRIQE